MRLHVRALPYWAVFGLGVSGGVAVWIVAVLRLHAAFSAGSPTRGVLVDSLGWVGVALALFLAAGWAFAVRPRRPIVRRFDGFTYL